MGAIELSAGPPDFVGVGAQRAGTSWWFRLLIQHPRIKRATAAKQEISPASTVKELHFFNQFCVRPMEDADIARYHALFPPHPGAIRGEWTPRYMYDPWTPPALRRAAPDARILVLLRDPVERFRSGVVHQGSFTPRRGIDALTVDAINRSRYASQIRRLHASFPAEQILVLQYERCRADALGEYARTLRFLGVDDGFEPEEIAKPRGQSTEAGKEPLWPELRDVLVEELEPDVHELQALVPDLDVSLWPHFAHASAVRS